jgi:hypothetical protein
MHCYPEPVEGPDTDPVSKKTSFRPEQRRIPLVISTEAMRRLTPHVISTEAMRRIAQRRNLLKTLFEKGKVYTVRVFLQTSRSSLKL